MKIYCPYNTEVKAAIAGNIAGAEFVDAAEADITLPLLPLPLRVGELLDIIAAGTAQEIKFGGFTLNPAKKTLNHSGSFALLTEKEIEILQFLSTQHSASRDGLLKEVWKYSGDASTNTVESHIYRLRQKIMDAFGVELISNENGNYKLIEI